jgi:hypothetical protein
MDPVTAGFNFATELVKFLQTPIGQRVAEDWLNLSVEMRIALIKAFTKANN